MRSLYVKIKIIWEIKITTYMKVQAKIPIMNTIVQLNLVCICVYLYLLIRLLKSKN